MDPSRRAQNQQYLLQGSIMDESVDILLQKLKGMCDSSDDTSTRYKEHEMVYSMREPSNQTVSVRVKKQLTPAGQPCLLTYLGQPEIGDKNRPTTVRTCVEVNCTNNVCSFLQELGFVMDFDFISQGWHFQKNRLRVTVTKIFRIHPTNVELSTPMTKSYLIEVSLISSAGNEQAPNEVQAFCEQLKPLVNMEKYDPRSMGSMRH